MFLFDLPLDTHQQLCHVLDNGEGWRQIALYLQLSEGDTEQCASSSTQGGSPTAQVLRIFAARGLAVTRLYTLLAIVRQRRAMACIEQYVATQHHDNSVVDISSAAQPITPKTSIASQSPSTLPSNQPSPSSMRLSTGQATTNASVSPSTMNSGVSRQSTVTDVLQNTLSVRYAELSAATDSFGSGNVIGKGGYGIVYRAEWKHTTVAVKRIVSRKSDSSPEQERERVRQSLMELKALSLYRHDNILALYGYSLDGPEPCIIYQYMAGKSLEDRLQPKCELPRPTWRERHAIMLGTCRGLNFLHTIQAQPLIHGDVKSANILLDAHLTPMLGDFGLSRLGQMEVSDNAPPLIASHIKGTLAYLPPEFIRSKHLSPKLDIYSTGVVFYEVATGLRPYSNTRQPESLAAYMRKIGDEEDAVRPTMDVTIPAEGEEEIFTNLVTVGQRCTVGDPAQRPDANKLISMLITHS